MKDLYGELPKIYLFKMVGLGEKFKKTFENSGYCNTINSCDEAFGKICCVVNDDGYATEILTGIDFPIISKNFYQTKSIQSIQGVYVVGSDYDKERLDDNADGLDLLEEYIGKHKEEGLNTYKERLNECIANYSYDPIALEELRNRVVIKKRTKVARLLENTRKEK